MSSLAIISVGTVTAGSVLAGAAMLTLGLGLGLGFYILSERDLNRKNMERLGHEVENVLYRLRKESEAASDDASTFLKDAVSSAEKLKASLFSGDSGELEKNMISFNESVMAARQRIEAAKLENSLEEKEVAAESPLPDLSRFSERKLETAKAGAKTPEGAEVAEILKYHGLLRKLDEKVHAELAPLAAEASAETQPQRLRMIKDNIKLRYGQVKEALSWTEVYRKNLGLVLEHPATASEGGAIREELSAVMSGKYVGKKEYHDLMVRASALIIEAERKKIEEQERHRLAGRVAGTLSSLGYGTSSGSEKLEALERGEIVYLDTKWEDYRVMLRLSEKGELTSRLARVVSSEAEKTDISEYQRERDRETARGWCADFDRFTETLREQGIGMNVVLRKEPEEEEVLYIVDKTEAMRKRASAAKSSGGARERKA